MSDLIPSTDLAHFTRDVLEADGPVLVDVWAPWCGPCRALEPHLEQLARARADLKIVKVCADDEPQLVAQLGVQALPTVLAFRYGSERGRHVGVTGAATLEALADTA